MICAYGSSRVGEIGAGVNTLTVNPLSTISSTLLAKKGERNGHVADLLGRTEGSCLILVSMIAVVSSVSSFEQTASTSVTLAFK